LPWPFFVCARLFAFCVGISLPVNTISPARIQQPRT
jgi:hypothetical protein